jgi:hypothetical protein
MKSKLKMHEDEDKGRLHCAGSMLKGKRISYASRKINRIYV